MTVTQMILCIVGVKSAQQIRICVGLSLPAIPKFLLIFAMDISYTGSHFRPNLHLLADCAVCTHELKG